MTMRYRIEIGSIMNLATQREEPRLSFEINEDEKLLIDIFASTRKDKNLNTIYKLNECEFKVTPIIEIDNSFSELEEL